MSILEEWLTTGGLRLVETACRSIERIADGLERRNELLEESNEMARENRDANRAIVAAAKRYEDEQARKTAPGDLAAQDAARELSGVDAQAIDEGDRVLYMGKPGTVDHKTKSFAYVHMDGASKDDLEEVDFSALQRLREPSP